MPRISSETKESIIRKVEENRNAIIISIVGTIVAFIVALTFFSGWEMVAVYIVLNLVFETLTPPTGRSGWANGAIYKRLKSR